MFNILSRRKDWKIVHSRPVRCNNDDVVVNGLAVTPSDIARLTERGIAVNTANASMFSFDANPSESLPPELRCDADRNTIWELSQRAKRKLLNVRRTDKAKYH